MLSALLACGDSDDDGATDSSVAAGQSVCEAYQELADQLGCTLECEAIAGECDDEGRAWVACARTDLTQCMCETDGDLNCEGSFKPNEGPARCIPEYTALDACIER